MYSMDVFIMPLLALCGTLSPKLWEWQKAAMSVYYVQLCTVRMCSSFHCFSKWHFISKLWGMAEGCNVCH